MAIGTRRSRGGDEYIFIDGKAMLAEEAIKINVDPVSVPGQDAVASVPGAAEAVGMSPADAAKAQAAAKRAARRKADRDAVKALGEDDAFGLRQDFVDDLNGVSLAKATKLMQDDKRKMRVKYAISGAALLVLVLFSLCVSNGYYFTIYSPADVFMCFVNWFKLTFIQITDGASWFQARQDVMAVYPMYMDVCSQVPHVVMYLVCGAILGVAGMLYQNAFRNPIAAPSMLGVSSGINLALLILVMIVDVTSISSVLGYYYLATFLGGILILVVVLAGGKWISGKGSFNVTNMILMGTIVSQLIGVVTQYIQNVYMTEDQWNTLYLLQQATGVESEWTYITLAIGAIAAIIPIFLLRFRLNLISYSDSEAKLLGVDPNKLRIVALACGSLMVLTSQVNAGQVAMASLVVPFVVRAVYGSEFRKQFWGNILMGSFILLLGSDIVSFVTIDGITLGLGNIITIVAMPLFVWMLAVRQRSWE